MNKKCGFQELQFYKHARMYAREKQKNLEEIKQRMMEKETDNWRSKQ